MVPQKTLAPRPQGKTAGASSPSARPPRAGAGEAALAFLALAAVAALLYLPHILHGGFYSDDWADAAARLYPPGGSGLGHVLDYFAGLFPYRPTLILYIPLKYYVFGTDISLQLAWTVGLGVIVAALLYVILRFFRVPWYHAWLVGALTLAYPWFDSTRFWEAASLSTFAIALAFAGVYVALLGLERRSWRWHACAATLYLLSILAYEITLPMIAAVGALYVLRFGWRAARARWGVDLAVAVAAGVWNAAHTNRTVSGVSNDLHHLREIVTAGGTLLGRTVYPLGSYGYTTSILVLIGVVLAAGAFTYFARSDKGETGWGLRQWLLLAAAGLALAAAGWAMFVPADLYYTPSVYGFTNRVNALAGLGLVIAVYAVLGVGTTLAALALPKARPAVPLVVIALGLMLGAAYVHVLERHSGIWDMAYEAERQGMARIKRAFPRLAPNSMVITSNYPAYQTLGVPIFSAGWDLNGMIKLEYEDGTLSAFPRIEGLEIACHADAIGVYGYLTPERTAPYGKVHLIDLQTGRHATPRNRRQCQEAAKRYLPGPEYLSFAY
jgi:hypothetical protein